MRREPTTAVPHGEEPVGARRRRLALAALLGGMTVLHAASPAPFEALVPRWLPGPARRWNQLATVAEGASALLLVRRRTARAGGHLAFATMLGVFPANVEAVRQGGYATAPAPFDGRGAAIARLPLQVPLLLWARRISREA